MATESAQHRINLVLRALFPTIRPPAPAGLGPPGPGPSFFFFCFRKIYEVAACCNDKRWRVVTAVSHVAQPPRAGRHAPARAPERRVARSRAARARKAEPSWSQIPTQAADSNNFGAGRSAPRLSSKRAEPRRAPATGLSRRWPTAGRRDSESPHRWATGFRTPDRWPTRRRREGDKKATNTK